MTRDPITDPEVIADLRLRAASEHDPRRTRGDGVYAWRPPAIVEHWPCRSCTTAMVGVTAEQVDARELFNRQLRARREPEIAKGAVVFCAACTARLKATSDRTRRGVDEIAALVRELKTLVDNDLRERSIAARLRDLGHPDVEGLLKAIAESRASKTTNRRSSL